MQTHKDLSANNKPPPLEPIPVERGLPASSSQQQLWYASQIAEPKYACNGQMEVRIEGLLDISFLECSLKKIIERHEALRTVFSQTDKGDLMQVIVEPFSISVPLIPIGTDGMNSVRLEQEISRESLEQGQAEYNLSTGPLFRVSVLQLPGNRQILLFSFHRIIMDGRSLMLLLKEINTLYATEELDEPGIQDADYACRERQWMATDDFQQRLDYWKKQLDGAPASLNFPFDYPRSVPETAYGAWQYFNMPKKLTKKLSALAQQENVSLYTVILAAYKTLLMRYSGQTDLAVGTVIANRPYPELKNLMGGIAETVILRSDLSADKTFRQLLAELRALTKEAFYKQAIPFNQLVDILRHDSGSTDTPLCQAALIYNSIPFDKTKLAGKPISHPTLRPMGIATFDITLSLELVAGHLQGYFEYNTDLLNAETVKRLLQDLRLLLKSVTENPDQTIQHSTREYLTPVIDDTQTPSPLIDNYTAALMPIEHTQPQPLSFAQQRLWFIHEFEGGTDTRYNHPLALHFTGTIDVTALQEAIQAIVQRHEILRTRYDTLDCEAVQIIDDTLILDIPVIETTKELVAKLIDEHMTSLFDLRKGPLIKVSILSPAPNETVLLINMHLIVCDGWSMDVFGHELVKLYDYYHALASLYDGYKAGYLLQPSFPLLPLPLQYADVSHWQRLCLQSDILEQQRGYWKTQLDGAPALLELPTDRLRPAKQSYSGCRYSFSVPAALTEQLRQLSQQSNATLFMTLLASFNILLSRYSRQDDICIATPAANRQKKELENLIGFFVNTLVLRTPINNSISFSDFLQNVKTTVLEAYSHQDIPFQHVMDALKPQRSSSYSPLFQVMFALQNPPEATFKLTGTSVSLIDVDTHKAKFDLSLLITEQKQALTGVVEFNTDLFDVTTIERFCSHYLFLLEGIVENPQQKVGYLPLLTDYKHQ